MKSINRLRARWRIVLVGRRFVFPFLLVASYEIDAVFAALLGAEGERPVGGGDELGYGEPIPGIGGKATADCEGAAAAGAEARELAGGDRLAEALEDLQGFLRNAAGGNGFGG